VFLHKTKEARLENSLTKTTRQTEEDNGAGKNFAISEIADIIPFDVEDLEARGWLIRDGNGVIVELDNFFEHLLIQSFCKKR
jgi:hypothetical protein